MSLSDAKVPAGRLCRRYRKHQTLRKAICARSAGGICFRLSVCENGSSDGRIPMAKLTKRFVASGRRESRSVHWKNKLLIGRLPPAQSTVFGGRVALQ